MCAFSIVYTVVFYQDETLSILNGIKKTLDVKDIGYYDIPTITSEEQK
jgi:hypothetical protein